MKHILVAIDFSQTSISAFYYASKLAELMKARLTVLHVVSIPLTTETGIISASYSIPFNVANEKMDYFINELPQEHNLQIPDIQIDSVVETGSPVITIATYTKENDVDLLVMGTIEKSSIFQRVLGSVTSATINSISIPVLLIHRNTQFVKASKSVFGIDDKGNLEDALEHYNKLNKYMNAYTEFVHIKSEDNVSMGLVKSEIIHELMDEEEVQYAFEIKEIPGDSPDQDIVDYSIFSKADLLVLIHHEKNIFQRLFRGSTSFSAANKIHIPVLIIPNP